MKIRLFSLVVFLFLSPNSYSHPYHTNLKPDLRPDCDGLEYVEHAYYSLCYFEEHEQSTWTFHELTADMLGYRRDRTDNYRYDPSISTGSVGGRGYRRSGYDRGHLVPAADMKITYQAMSESFFMSNMSPQIHNFNAGIWAYLEGRVRRWAKEKGHVMIVTGPILKPGLKKIASGVSIPEEFYKIVLHYNFDDPEQSEVIAFRMPHRPTRERIEKFVVTVDELEDVTGHDFFGDLPDRLENDLESNIDTGNWLP